MCACSPKAIQFLESPPLCTDAGGDRSRLPGISELVPGLRPGAVSAVVYLLPFFR